MQHPVALFSSSIHRADMIRYAILCGMIYLLIIIELSPGGSSTVHIYTQTIHRTTQTEYTEQNIHNNKNTET